MLSKRDSSNTYAISRYNLYTLFHFRTKSLKKFLTSDKFAKLNAKYQDQMLRWQIIKSLTICDKAGLLSANNLENICKQIEAAYKANPAINIPETLNKIELLSLLNSENLQNILDCYEHNKKDLIQNLDEIATTVHRLQGIKYEVDDEWLTYESLRNLYYAANIKTFNSLDVRTVLEDFYTQKLDEALMQLKSCQVKPKA